ncbi:YppE family protein [Scopulibacillus cellulosilyticus]|uniref:YppE family protein n=1 Tax=Scopulibacillus cellulosilyticus TaxID=2665665 RepID=A0ABW2PTD5_9BACL
MDKEKIQTLRQLTRLLKEYNQMAYEQFVNRTRKEGYEVDFYGAVKPFADKVLAAADQWKPLALEWINKQHPKYVYHIQINDTYDNLTITSVTAFQKDTRRRRFLETIKAVDYVLDAMLNQL